MYIVKNSVIFILYIPDLLCVTLKPIYEVEDFLNSISYETNQDFGISMMCVILIEIYFMNCNHILVFVSEILRFRIFIISEYYRTIW
jgi:hypothetical protein